MSYLRGAAGGVVAGNDVVPSPNIWHWPDIYEIENRAQDSRGALHTALHEECTLNDSDIVDLGCGDGYHLGLLGRTARSVIGIEPHPPLVTRARERVRAQRLAGVSVLAGSAERIPLPDAVVDVVHARTAYFFGPGCEPGLVEVDRVLRPGGALVVVDLDGRSAPYGDWLCADTRGYRPSAIEKFFTAKGFASRSVATLWTFECRADLEAVLRIEFSAPVAALAIARTPGLQIEVGYRLRVRTKPGGLIR
ncbi:MAG: methyltransferase domain-containing protein [Sciscionella sp.]